MLVTHTNAHYDKDDNYVMPGRLRVLPISWLYGGAKNMKPNEGIRSLKKAFEIP